MHTHTTDTASKELKAQRDLVRRPHKRIAALALAAGLTVALTVPGAVVFADGVGSTSAASATSEQMATDSDNSTPEYKKNQVVYVKTDADGNRTGVYVVNSFEANKGVKIDDAGTYNKVTNLSTTQKLTDDSGSVAVTGQGVQDFVYQGDLDKNTQMPWNVTVAYQLDGRDIDAKDLAGKSGKLTMKLKVEKNDDYTGGDYADNYLVQITGQLKDAEAHDIEAEGATVAANGSNTQLTYMVIPGSTGDYTITTDVEDFEFDGWQIVGVPLNLAIDVDSSSMDTSQLVELSNGIATANSGAGQVADGVKTLAASLATANTGAGTLSSGAAALAAGTSQLNAQVPTLVEGVSNLNAGAEGVNAGAVQLKGGASDLSAGLSKLQGSAQQISGGISGIAAGSDTYVDALTLGKQAQEANLAKAQAAAKAAQDAVTATSGNAYSALYGPQGLTAALSGEGQYLAGAQQALGGAKQAASAMGNDAAKANAESAKAGAESTVASIAAAKAAVADAQDALDNAADLDSAKAAAAKLSEATAQLDAATASAGSAATSAGAAATAASSADATGLTALLDSASNAVAGAQGLNTQVSQGLKGAESMFGTLTDQVTTLAQAAGAQGGAQGAVTALDSAIQGYTTVQDGQQLSLAGAIAYMNSAINPANPTAVNPGLVAGVGSAATGAGQLSDGAAALAAGTDQLAAGTQQLNGATPALANGASQLNNGAAQLKTGAASLASGMNLLSSGAGTLASGASELGNGMQELTDRTSNLDTQVIDTVKDKIEEMLDPGFTPTDFVNGEQGGHINRVQFIYMTGAISK